MAESVGRLCEVDGCGRRHRARGLCSTHYNEQHQPDRHRKVVVSCTYCGKGCEKQRSNVRRPYCSYACRDTHRLSTPEGRAAWALAAAAGRAAAAAADHSWSPRRKALFKLQKAARGVKGWGIWCAGPCAHCGDYFVRHSSAVPTSWCSRRCRNAAHSRRHRKGNGSYNRHDVFRRDGWRCHLCGKLTDRTKRHPHPNAPTIDHLIPRIDGGLDALENVATAHSWCNSYRRQFGTVQLLLIG